MSVDQVWLNVAFQSGVPPEFTPALSTVIVPRTPELVLNSSMRVARARSEMLPGRPQSSRFLRYTASRSKPLLRRVATLKAWTRTKLVFGTVLVSSIAPQISWFPATHRSTRSWAPSEPIASSTLIWK